MECFEGCFQKHLVAVFLLFGLVIVTRMWQHLTRWVPWLLCDPGY